jgi:hypothetical protein
MDNLNNQELTELITFYKQKAYDTEFALVQTQLKFNKSFSFIEELQNIIKIHESTINSLKESEQSLQNTVTDLLKPKPKKPRP